MGEATIDLNNLGFVQVCGVNNFDTAVSNGSGKSSIFDAILWAITGATSRGTKDVKNIYSDEGTTVELEFSVDSTEYVVRRYREHSRYKNQLFVCVDGKDISGKGLRESDKILHETLPKLSTEFLSSIMIIGQGMPDRFSSNSPSNRKLLLERLTNQDCVVQSIRDKISDYTDMLQRQVSELKLKLDSTVKRKEEIQSEIARYTEKLSEYKDIDSLQSDYKDTQNKISQINKEISEYKESISVLEDRITCHKDKLSDLFDKYTKDRNDIQALKNKALQDPQTTLADLVRKLDIVSAKIREIESIPDVCPVCKRKMDGKVDTTEYRCEMETLQNDVSNQQSEINNIASVYDAMLQDTEFRYDKEKVQISYDISSSKDERNKCEEIVRAKLSECMSLQNHATKLQSLIESYYSQKDFICGIISEKERDVDSLSRDMEFLPDEISKKEKDIQACVVMNQIARKEYRTYLLSDTISFLNSICKKYSKAVFDTEDLSFTLDEQNIFISYAGKEYESLSGGEKQKVDLIIQFAIKSLLCDYYGVTTNLIVLDEIFDNLDMVGCNRIIDLIVNELKDVSSVFIVSHHPSLQIPYDRTITVTKNSSGISSVSIL